MRKKLALVLSAVVLSGVGCGGDDSLSDMQLRAETGVVTVLRGTETIPVEGRVELEPGDVIVTENEALAMFALEGGADARQGQIQGGSKVLVRSTTSLEAQAGSVLLQVSSPTEVLVDGVTANSSQGTFRVDRGLGSVRTGVYTGSTDLDAPGQADLNLPRLYQATIVAGDLPNQSRPYRLDLKDLWDASLLDDVVDLEEDLQSLGRGLSTQLGRQRPDVRYFSALVDGADVSFVRSYLRRQPADLLIGFTIARHADLTLKRGFRKAFDLFDQGARWGVAAKIMEVEPRPVLAQLERLILGTGAGEGQAEFTVAAADAAEPLGADDPGPTTTSEEPEITDPSDPGEPPTDEPKKPREPKDPPDEDPEECTDSAECLREDIEDQLPQPSPEPTDPSPSPSP